jgi:hypothetical protein
VSPPALPSSTALRLALFVLLLAVCVVHSLQYDFVTDDAYISFVYARNFAETNQLVFNPGDRVEGYTNFLWTLLLGLLMKLGLAPEVTALVLGSGFALGTLCLVLRLMSHVGERPSPWDLLPVALLSLSAGYACWASGGLETQMFTFWVTLAIDAAVRARQQPRQLVRAGVALALAAMTRPEGLLVAAVVGGHRLAATAVRERRLVPRRDEWLAVASFLALYTPYFAWRYWYYGHPFPNTYYVKAGGTPPPGYRTQLLENGIHYVRQWARQTGVLHAAPLWLAGLCLARPGERRLYLGTLVLPLALLYLVYTVRVGGDFMGLHRFIMPLFVVAALGVALGLRRIVALVPARWRPLAGMLGATALIAGFGVSQLRLTRQSTRWGNWNSDHGIDTPAYLDVFARDRAAIGRHMRTCFRPDDFSIVGGAGAQPYWGRMRAIDVFGLVSRRIAHEVPATRPRAGHNKWGPDPLLLEHDPDFVFSCYSIHAAPDRPQLNCDPGFWLRHGYEQVTLHIPTLVQGGKYYTFFARSARQFRCPGRVR